jgi:hypothetical protein
MMRSTPTVTVTMVIAGADGEPVVRAVDAVDEVLGMGKKMRGSTATPASARMTTMIVTIAFPLASAIATTLSDV